MLPFSTSYAATKPTKPQQTLELGKSLERKLNSKDKHTYTISLKKNDFLLLIVDQRGIDITLEVLDPNGQKLADIDNTPKTEGQENLVMIADTEGDYKLIVQPVDHEKPSTGNYQIKIQELRPATKRDSALLSARTLQADADFYYSQNSREQFLAALKTYEQALELFQVAENKKGQGACLRGLALCYYSLNENLKSLEYHEKALAIWNELGEQYSKASTLLAIGGVYYVIDDYQTALNYYEQSLSNWIDIKSRYGEGYTLAAIGNAKVSTGDYFKAIECYYQSIQAYQDAKNLNAEANTQFSLSNAFFLLGEFNEALSNYQHTLELFQTTGDQKGEANTLASLGQVNAQLGKKDAAIENYNKAIDMFHEQDEVIAEGFAKLGLSSVYALSKEFDKALEQGNLSLDIFLAEKDKRGEAIAFSNIGLIQFKAGNKEKAKENYQKAIDIFRSLNYRSGEAAMLYGLATVARDLGNLAEAQTQIEAALKVVDSPTLKITEQEIREFSFTELRNYFDFYIDILMQSQKNKPDTDYSLQAFQINERARNRFLQDILTNVRPTITGIAPDLLAKERKVNQLIRNKTRSQMKILSAEYTAKQIVDASKDLEKFAAQYKEIQTEIKEKSPRYAELMYPEPIAIKDLQKQLSEDTILLEYWLGEEHSYLWLITPTQIESFELPKRQDIEELAIKYHQLLRSRNDRIRYYNGKALNQTVSPEEADNQLIEVSSNLSKILLKPVAAKLGKAKLVIIGEKALHFIPFAALPNPNDEAKKTPMLVDHEIVNLTSAASLKALSLNASEKNDKSEKSDKGDKKPLNSLVAVLSDPIVSIIDERVKKPKGQEEPAPLSILQSLKDPAHLSIEIAYRAAEDVGLLNEGYRMPRLPLAQLEAKQIAKAVGADKTKQFAETTVNRSAINSEELRQCSIIHFATYTFLNSKHPSASGITLSLFDNSAKEQDNFLKLKDLYNLNLPADLLVFSAGGTTLKNDVRAEGLYALSRGLIYSGSNRAIFSLWTVNDEARAELMSRFYQELGKQKQLQPAAALRAAQIAIWGQKRWQSPYYWAPFILLSDGK